ncbi:MAG TPA: serine hydrolase domain-containing protein [Terriglobales bacterium]|nr:serine hydrolase domain-containing protein [Terriglobales bacterium]
MKSIVLFLALLLSSLVAFAQSSLTPQQTSQIDQLVGKVLAERGVPSASIAAVKDGKLVFAKGYGQGRLSPAMASTPETRYAVGSISKQFTAAALLMLQQEGKLSIDDPVGKYMPDLTRANEVTIRELLSHTSGYQDYYPQDYVPEFMQHPTTTAHILDTWAKRPLDFDPGTKWQYSNTNYVIAGAIAEKVSGEPIFQLLNRRIFQPLGMKSVFDIDHNQPAAADALGYFSYGDGPNRVQPKEGDGWLFAAGELDMTASDLMKWDIAMMNESLLQPASYKQMETVVLLKNGESTGYGLGVDIGSWEGHRAINHSGEVSGYTAMNAVLPDDHLAVAVQTNKMAGTAAGPIARGVVHILLSSLTGENTQAEDRARTILDEFQSGKIERSQFSEDCNQYFDATALHDYQATLANLGQPESVKINGEDQRGGMTFRALTAQYANKQFTITEYELPDGKLEQFLLLPRD